MRVELTFLPNENDARLSRWRILSAVFKIANSIKEKEQIYRLRYQVYCEERGWINASICSQNLEIDEYDRDSIHFIALDEDENVIGTIRLIRSAWLPLPIETRCHIKIDDAKVSRNRIAEVSRLVVDKKYQCRKPATNGHRLKGYNGNRPSHAPLRCSEIVLGLYSIMFHEARRRNITLWYAAMEKSLLRLLHRCGFGFQPIGKVVDYYGPVVPCMATVPEVVHDVKVKNPGIYRDYFHDTPALIGQLSFSKDPNHIEEKYGNFRKTLANISQVEKGKNPQVSLHGTT